MSAPLIFYKKTQPSVDNFIDLKNYGITKNA